MRIFRWLGRSYRRLSNRCRILRAKTYVSTYSGTKTKGCGYVSAFGESRFLILSENAQGTVSFTVREIQDSTIRCAWCGKPIFARDGITLLTPMREIPGTTEWHGLPKRERIPKAEANLKEYAVVYNEDPLQLVGCTRDTCCDLMDQCGMWIPDPDNPGKGKVHRMPSAVELLLANPDKGCAIGNREGSGPLDITLCG